MTFKSFSDDAYLKIVVWLLPKCFVASLVEVKLITSKSFKSYTKIAVPLVVLNLIRVTAEGDNPYH